MVAGWSFERPSWFDGLVCYDGDEPVYPFPRHSFLGQRRPRYRARIVEALQKAVVRETDDQTRKVIKKMNDLCLVKIVGMELGKFLARCQQEIGE